MEKEVLNGTPVISLSPIILSAPGRGEDLQLRVSAPATGSGLPIIIFAHGYGSSLNGYGPLVDFWTARGFAVIQPTFLDSRTLAIRPEDPRTPLIWKFRVEDMKRVLDNLDLIENAVPGLKGRLDRDRIAAVGHSFGAQTSGMLLGARIFGADGSLGEDMSDPRIKVGILLTPAGKGGEDLSPYAAENFPFMNPSYAEMTKPTLIVAGDNDISALTVRGADWFYDAYFLSPGKKSLLTLYGGEHGLGGIAGYQITETTDENPKRIEAVQRLTWAYLRSAFYPEDNAWQKAGSWLMESPDPQGKVESK